MKLIIKVLIISLIILLLGYLIGNTTTVRAEDRVKTLQSEIIRLSTKYKVDSKIASKIIFCESSNLPDAKRINDNETIDYSYWQINNHYWQKDMLKLGLDITNPEDNLEAGFYLYSQYGNKLWNWSSKCWNK